MRDQKRKQVAAETSVPTDSINYDDAVIAARKIIADAECGQWRLGELADRVEPKYGDRTLAKFATAIGVASCTLARYRDVYRAWKDICAPGRELPSYSILRELASHANRAEIIQEHPDITKREALALKRKLKGSKKENQEPEWLKDTRRGFRELYTHAEEAARIAEAWLSCTPEKQHELLQAVEPLKLRDIKSFAAWLRNFADDFEALLEEEEAAEQKSAEASASPTDVHSEPLAQAAA
jgi:hypothetical protein